MLIIGKQDSINAFKLEALKRLVRLSMRITRHADGSVDQTSNTEEILQTFKVTDVKVASTRLHPSMKYHGISDAEWNIIKERGVKKFHVGKSSES
ncbi:hypothetical protein CDAR_612421 [Caerostris darwini]|uniref:Uncharacterized protein n=1 Tax=Caerostris darwini TaxID=1538125 RepID=A0AAV4SFQ4_9ARAC|nr:hypothetical protein CDAR_612421 [Caerostris darwini]